MSPRYSRANRVGRLGLTERFLNRVGTVVTRFVLPFARNQRGATVVFLAISIIPLLAFIGLAVDTTRGYLVKSRLSSAVDAAALAGGRVFTSPNRDDDVQMYFTANFPAGYMGATTEPITITPDNIARKLVVSAEAVIPTSFMHLVGIDSMPVSATAEVAIESQNVEVSLVLDVTGSMANGTKLPDLKTAANALVDIVVQDDQSLFYSKVGIVPYSQAVNVGGYATQVRGSILAGKPISTINKANPVVVTTSVNHGFITGDKVFIANANNGTSHQANNLVTANADATRPNFWTITKITDTSFSLKRCAAENRQCTVTGNVNGSSWSNHTAGTGTVYCTTPGCAYYAYQNETNSGSPSLEQRHEWIVNPISTCVTERAGADAYTDTEPSTTPLGRHYQSPSGNNCLTPQIVPLSSDKTTLHNQINALTAGGSTGGHIGVGWGWYLLAPKFSYLWPAASQPAAYGTPKLLKVVIIMTDGEYNSIYYNGVIARDSLSGSGSDEHHIDQDGHNGNTYIQAQALCAAMKGPGKGVIVYTVGLQVESTPAALALVNGCATSASHVYLPDSGAEMEEAFKDIAMKISKLRLSK